MSDTTMTLPQVFRDRAKRYGKRAARISKRNDAWQEMSWEAWRESVDAIARGLMAEGMEKGQAVSILSGTRAEWSECDLAIMSAAGVTIPIYPSSLADDVQYILENSESIAIFCEDGKQLKKVLSERDKLPLVKRAILIDGAVPSDAPTRADGAPFVITLAELKAKGSAIEPAALDARVDSVKETEICTIVYTSGTTGKPKGVVQTHKNHLASVRSIAKLGLVTEEDKNLQFLPLAHSFARCEAFAQLYFGFTTAYAESIEKLVANLGEVKPTLLFSVPRIYEKAFATMLAKTSASPVKKKLFAWAAGVGRQVSELKQNGQAVPFVLGLQYALAQKLVLAKIQAVFGGKIRFCVSGGAPLAKDIAAFFHAAGVLILEGYGLTETCPVLTLNTDKAFRFGTVGKPLPGVEIKFGPDGEILGKGDNIALGYYKREAETKEVFLEQGWFATGDIGEFDKDGFLRITDRKKDLIKTSGGKYVAPQEIENKLKGFPLVAQCMVHGDLRKFCSVVIVPAKDPLLQWAKDHGADSTDYAKLVKSEAVQKHFEGIVETLNKSLASYEQPKKVLLAVDEWTPEGGELTPTLKVKRKVVTAKFKKELDAFYDDKD